MLNGPRTSIAMSMKYDPIEKNIVKFGTRSICLFNAGTWNEFFCRGMWNLKGIPFGKEFAQPCQLQTLTSVLFMGFMI